MIRNEETYFRLVVPTVPLEEFRWHYGRTINRSFDSVRVLPIHVKGYEETDKKQVLVFQEEEEEKGRITKIYNISTTTKKESHEDFVPKYLFSIGNIKGNLQYSCAPFLSFRVTCMYSLI